MSLLKGLRSTRLVIAVMLFLACFISYSMRVNISISLIAMVVPSGDNGTVPEAECGTSDKNHSDSSHEKKAPDYGTRYDWGNDIQGLILGSYFYGYLITCFLGGLFAEKFGATRTIMVSSIIASVVTILTPLMASWHYATLIVSRVLVGLCGGVVYPCLHCLVSRWAPPHEKGRFIGALLGGSLGTVITWPVLGFIIESLGWTWSFYLNGGFVLLWCITWMILVADSPEKHSRISEEEKKYILNSLGDTVKPHKGIPPYKHIVLSVPFWALVILHFGNLWGLYFLMTAGPKFLATVLGFPLGKTGFLAALPYLSRTIFGFIFGLIGDTIRERNLLSTTLVRKGFVLFSHIIPGILLIALNATGCHVAATIALITLSLGSNGASTLTNLQNAQDLAPNYAGTLYGIANGIGTTTGFITPTVVGLLTRQNNGLDEWHIIFSIGAAVYIISGVIFCIFGTSTIQSWNTIKSGDAEGGVQNPAFDNTNS